MKHVNLKYIINPSSKQNNPKNLVLLHGLLGSKNNWKGISNNKTIKEMRNLIQVDLRNHGGSGHDQHMSYELMAIDLHNLLFNNLHLNKFTLLGHSMGGKVAMAYACLYPDSIDGLIILDSSPEDYRMDHEIYFGYLKEIVRKANKMNIIGKSRQEIMNDLIQSFGPEFGNLIGSNLIVGSNVNDNKWRVNLDYIEKNIENILGWKHVGVYHGEIVCICGEKSKPFSIEKFIYTFPNIKKEDIRIINDASHWVHADKPEEVCVEIVDFIKRIDNRL